MPMRWARRSVSSTESFLSSSGITTTFIGVYIATNAFLFLKASVEEGKLHQDFQRYVTGIARGCGATINLNIGVVLLLASRTFVGFLQATPVNMILPIDRAMPGFHRVVGKLLLFAGLLHSVMHYVTYAIKGPWSKGYSGFTSLFITGTALLILVVIIRFVARAVIYQSNFEVFSRVHIGGSILLYALVIIHGLHHSIPNTWKWVIGPIILYVLDIAIRIWRVKKSYLLVSKHSAVFQGPDILKIRLPRVLHFEAGQYAELKVPELSHFQWHPFTIASAPHEPEMVFYIKAVGNWTKSLYQLFSERVVAAGGDIEVHIRGPYGSPAQHFGQFGHVILVGGGVGATPFCSITKDAYNWMTNWAPQNNLQEKSGGVGQNREGALGPDANNRARHVVGQSPQIPSNERFFHGGQESHLFTTNVNSVELDSAELEEIGPVIRSKNWNGKWTRSKHNRTASSSRSARRGTASHLTSEPDIPSGTTLNDFSLHTARDFLSTPDTVSSNLTSTSNGTGFVNSHTDRSPTREVPVKQEVLHNIKSKADSIMVDERCQKRAVLPAVLRQTNTTYDETAMGTFRDNSAGPHQPSLDYMSAIYSAYSTEQSNEVYQQSLDMMVGLSFGSAALIRKVRKTKVQRSMLDVPPGELPQVLDREELRIFQNQRIMFLLFMRSVTVNIILLWVVIGEFIVAGVAYIFDELTVFEQGLGLYKSQVMNLVDLVLAILITLLIGIPSVLEAMELGTDIVHGLDLFFLTPLAMVGVVIDILALSGVGLKVNVFGIMQAFVLRPLLIILVLTRLIRVIGERIAQAENLTRTHSNTKQVEFYWTAPTAEDDEWLVNELKPCSNATSVQMHRFLTRCTGEEQDIHRSTRGMPSLHTHFGRPNWDEILNETAELSQNDSTVGVFFCGPHSMGLQLQAACAEAMRNSIVRGLHSGTVPMRGLEEVFGEAISANGFTGETSDKKSIRKRGCNVKFVFKRESFL